MSEAKSEKKTNGLAVAGLISAFFIPLLGLILSIVGLIKSRERGGKGLAIGGIVVSIVVGFFQLILVVVLIAGLSSSADSSEKKTSSSSDSSQATMSESYRFDERADKQKNDVEVLAGETANIDDMELTVNTVEYKSSLGEFEDASPGKTYVVANVTLNNKSNKTQPYNVFDFRVQTVGGQVLDGAFTIAETLSSGDLVSGGTVSGNVIFEVPIEEGHQYMIWKPSYFNSDRVVVQLK